MLPSAPERRRRSRRSTSRGWSTAILADPAPHIGKVYELTGPRSEDLHAIAAQFSRALGRPIRYVDVPPEPWEEKAARAGPASPHLAAHLAAMAALHRQNRYDRHTNDVERLTGTPPMTVEAVRAPQCQRVRAEGTLVTLPSIQ